MSDLSASQEKLAAWLVVMVGITATVELLSSFCAFWGNLFDLFLFLIKCGVSTFRLSPPPPPSHPGTQKEYLVKLSFWLVVVVGIAAAVKFFLVQYLN